MPNNWEAKPKLKQNPAEITNALGFTCFELSREESNICFSHAYPHMRKSYYVSEYLHWGKMNVCVCVCVYAHVRVRKEYSRLLLLHLIPISCYTI